MAEETRDRLMDATYRALCEHGYAALTMQDIADEGDCSKSLLHYHYDTKEELLVALLAYLLERFEARVAPEGAEPREPNRSPPPRGHPRCTHPVGDARRRVRP